MNRIALGIAALCVSATAAFGQALSPDGTVLVPGTGSLVALSGTWGFNTLGDAVLNGNAVTSSWPTLLEVAGGGNLYAQRGTVGWYEWSGKTFVLSPTPPPAPPADSPQATVCPAGQEVVGYPALGGPLTCNPFPQGPIAEGQPPHGATCSLGDSEYVENTNSTVTIFVCGPSLTYVAVGPFPSVAW